MRFGGIMKKLIVALLTLAVVATVSIGVCINVGVVEQDADKWHKVRVADERLYADNYEYIDYAAEVRLDREKYPFLERDGMFWCYWNEATESVEYLSAETEEGAALVDTSKPTLINVHGMQADGYKYVEQYWFPSGKYGTEEELGYTFDVQMTKFWLDKGYNVGIYNYISFASEGAVMIQIEEKVWAINGTVGMRYQAADQSFVEDVTDYCLAEIFAADYIRAVNMLPEDFGKEEIRIAAHSMGGEVVSAGLFLLTELADAQVGQIDRNKLPDRYIMEDTYFSIYQQTSADAKPSNAGPKGLICNWSGKKLPSGAVQVATIEALKDIAANGIALEYYSCEGSYLRFGISDDNKKALSELCLWVDMYSDYAGYGKGFDTTGDWHNAVREYYLTSILKDVPEDYDELTDEEKVACAANLSLEDSLRLRGRCFSMTEGAQTVTANDDVYKEVNITDFLVFQSND